MPATTTTARLGAGALDVVAIVVFVSIGRSVHRHGLTAAGLASTVWPFGAGLAAGWAAAGWRRPLSAWSGAVVCAATVAVGMTLRVAAGQGTAAAFVGVSVGFLGAVMVGGRLLARAARAWLSGRPAPRARPAARAWPARPGRGGRRRTG